MNKFKKRFKELNKGTQRVHYVINILIFCGFLIAFINDILEYIQRNQSPIELNEMMAVVLNYILTTAIYWAMFFLGIWIIDGYKNETKDKK